MKSLKVFIGFLITLASGLPAQDYVNITFRHYPSKTNVVRAFVPGTFNDWGPNNSGRIDVNAPSRMTFIDSLGFYAKTYRFRIGDSHQYKLHEQYNSSGSEWAWFTDPLNPLFNISDNNNSLLKVTAPLIFQIWPKNEAIVNESQPRLSCGIFSSENDSILLDRSQVYLDGVLLSTLEGHFLPHLGLLSLPLPGLANGEHQLVIRVQTRSGKIAADSTKFKFNLVSGDIFFYTPNVDSVWSERKIIRWGTHLASSQLKNMVLHKINSPAVTIPIQTESDYQREVILNRGENQYVVEVTDLQDQKITSDTLRINFPAAQIPQPLITFRLRTGGSMQVIGAGHDPNNQEVQFHWQNQPTNPIALPGVDGRSESTFRVDVPQVPGDYALKLTVTDPDGHQNSTVNFFSIRPDSSVMIPKLETVPLWVENAQIYCMFIRSYTEAGTIRAAMDNLDHIKNMGFGVIWVLPVMDVEGVLDQGTNIGYNIIDFYNVEPVYGTNQDFKDFVARAHQLGLRVILDVTPNHSSRSHAIALDVRSKKKFSRYYDFYQHQTIPHNDNGLGQSISSDGIVYYRGFSDALLNWNFADAEARNYMLDVYTHWLREYDLDGFRFDVYWGPHRRYGRENFDLPLRAALRAAKADIMLLAETDGTGAGTELIYADAGGGVDLGYDWILKGTVWNSPAFSALHSNLYNDGFRPGPNSYFLRFLENQDEDRVAFRYNSIEKTIPVATAIFMATGIPLIFQGQEVGMGYGMPAGPKEPRIRSTVNWQNPPGKILAPHYQKLAQIRAQFPAFRRQLTDTNADSKITSADKNMQPRLTSSTSGIYILGRPYADQNGLVVMNFTAEQKDVSVALQLPGWAEFTDGFQTERSYYLNALIGAHSVQVNGTELDTLKIQLNPYQSEIFTLGTTADQVRLPELTVGISESKQGALPDNFKVYPNYPNPFNPATTIAFDLAQDANIQLDIFNVLGQKVRQILNRFAPAGHYQVVWDGRNDLQELVPSGVYFYRFQANDFIDTGKMLLLK